MNLQLTKEQLESLVKVVYLGNWLANSWRTDDVIKEYDEIEGLILKAAEDNGLGNLVEHVEAEAEEACAEGECKDEAGHDDECSCHCHNRAEGSLAPSAELEEAGEEAVDFYNDNTFWDQLIYRMADRDYAIKYGDSALEQIFSDEGMAREKPFIEKYEKEFYDNGLDRLEIRRDN